MARRRRARAHETYRRHRGCQVRITDVGHIGSIDAAPGWGSAGDDRIDRIVAQDLEAGGRVTGRHYVDLGSR